MNTPLALVIDDESDIRELLEMTLARMDIDTCAAAGIAQARKLLQEKRFDLCLTDMKLPDGSGIELVEHIQQHHPDLPTAVITAHGNVESAVQALKAGAFDFVSKPVDLHMLRKLVTTALRLSRQHKTQAATGGPQLLGNSPAMEGTRARIAKLARSQAPVFISGESGTGKELAARLIHDQGPRRDGPFIPVNCGAIAGELMESEFFGHKKGSFTGAVSNKEGLFQAADGGTLFLDEVADLPLHMQVKLLRAIQEKAVRPVGEQQERPVDVRILSASHKDLAALVKEGSFRQDLFYRINVIELHLPSLRERRDDIPLLIEHILERLALQSGMEKPGLAPEALDTLQNYFFPGNVRELENILERAMTLCENNLIHSADLQLHPVADAEEEEAASAEISLEPYLGNVEKATIVKALEQTRYNKTAAAKRLGITFGALRYRMKKLGLD